MNINVISDKGKPQQIEISEVAFGREFNEPLVHQVVVAQQAALRQGTKRQLARNEVSGSDKKQYAQKGTGRARHGSLYDCIQRGGGRAFPARPRNFEQKVNKKMYRGAIQSILSELIRQDRLMVVESFELSAPKTKLMVERLKTLNVKDALILVDHIEENLFLASRNIPNVAIAIANGIDAVNLLRFKKVILTVAAVRQLEEVLG